MAIDFQEKISDALIEINHQGEYFIWTVQGEQSEVNSLANYVDAQWKIVDLLNEKYGLFLDEEFDLYNWINFNPNDEVAYFLSEAGSNCLNYAQHKAPHKFHLWLGGKGFVIGIEQKGEGFPAERVNAEMIKENEGAAFNFFRNCRNTVFFDNPRDARIVFMKSKF